MAADGARIAAAGRLQPREHAPARRGAGERTLHVAALPFPSPQGTQAAIAAILRALADAGDEVRLLAYAHGAAFESPPRYDVLRCAERWPYRSLRSGPSLHKLSTDFALARRLREAERAQRPATLVAHHVEAAVVALLVGRAPRVFFAHTDLGHELPCYAPVALARALERCGGQLDRLLVRSCGAVAAVSPKLAERLQRHAPEQHVQYVPVPWAVAAPITPQERARARAALDLDPAATVLGYAGNLDAYQGWPALLQVLVKLQAARRRVRLVVATSSDAGPLRAAARRAGVGTQLAVSPLGRELDRRRLHAAIDVAVVPRCVEGGVPIKLLDALARGVPCVGSRTASAGLPLGAAAAIAEGDDAEALAATIESVLSSPKRRAELSTCGPSYVRRAHAQSELVHALHALQERARARAARRPSPLTRRGAPS